ncbi:MAG: Ig-like domain-containing protein, partial [Ruminococcus flavefaciens]|nr:Ig-like domain-containing protein [Ruminococcus flavefaciens]
GTLQLSGLMAYNTAGGKNAMTAGDFDGYAGNLEERLTACQGVIDFMYSGKLQIGMGMCGVLSARGFVSLKLQFEYGYNDYSDDLLLGAKIGASGGVGYDLLLFSINIEYGNISAGWGSLESQPDFSFFGGLLDIPLGGTNKGSAFSLNPDESDAVLKTAANGKQLLLHPYSAGTSDLSGFGKNDGKKRASLEAVSVTPLLNNAAEHARPRIIALDNGRKMMVFIGSRGGADQRNSMALYYTVYDGSAWSKPQIIADDGTVDSTPDIIKKGDKVVIAWADASRTFTSADIDSKTNKLKPDTLSAMNISVAIYDISSGTMGDEIPLVEDAYFNLSPQLDIDGTKIYCSYMKRDLAGMKDETDLLDLTKLYSTMAYVTYDFGSGIQLDRKNLSEERFIEMPHQNLEDPLVIDFTSVTTEVDGDTYLLSAYTVDEDENLNTDGDRELYLQVYNASRDRHYFPIRITGDSVNQGNPKLTDLDGVVYLTWLEEGYLFHMMDVSELMEMLFDTASQTLTLTETDSDGNTVQKEMTIDKTKYIDSYIRDQQENPDWYQQSAEDLGVDKTYYEDSLYADIAKGNFRADSANLRQNPEITTSISDYSLVTDGKDIYLFFTDFGTEEDSTGQEIYGVKYQRGLSEEEHWGFGKAVQLTHENQVIDEIDLYMTEDDSISLVSNYYSQWIDENGNMQYGSNQIVEMDFETTDSLAVAEEGIALPSRLVGGETDQLSFEVKNEGLLSATGFSYTVSQITGNTESIIGQGESEEVLESGESVKLTLPWSVPKDVSNTSIRIRVKESGTKQSKTVEAMKAVPYGSSLHFEDTQVLWNGNTPYVETTLINTGNAPSKAYSGTLCLAGDDGKEIKTYQEFAAPALASGESTRFELPFTPAVDDYSALGLISLKLAVADGKETLETHYTKLSVSSPVCAQINAGEKSIKLTCGKTASLKTKAAPWNEIAGEVRFYSSDEAVAVVDQKGVVTGTGTGEATIYAYYVNTGASASIAVSVSKGNGDEASKPTAAPNTGKPTAAQALAAATKKLTAAKREIVIAAGKSKKIAYVAQADSAAAKAAAVTVSVSGNPKITAKIAGSAVKITVAKKAVKG